MKITESFSLNVKDYCEYCPDFSPCSENLDVTTIEDLPNRKAIHAITCLYADQCNQIRNRMKVEMEKQHEKSEKSEKSEKIHSNVRGCENKGSENGTDSDNGQSDGGKARVSDIRQKENQCAIVKSDKGGWREKLMKHFLRWH